MLIMQWIYAVSISSIPVIWVLALMSKSDVCINDVINNDCSSVGDKKLSDIEGD